MPSREARLLVPPLIGFGPLRGKLGFLQMVLMPVTTSAIVTDRQAGHSAAAVRPHVPAVGDREGKKGYPCCKGRTSGGLPSRSRSRSRSRTSPAASSALLTPDLVVWCLLMHLLYFWRGDNYRRDLDHGVGFHLNQANPLLHQIGIGEGLWAFTRKIDGRYALAAELVISAKTMNPRGFRYGPYRVWGDLRRSRYFGVDEQPDISTLIRSLAVKAKADVLGSSFQGKAAIRALSETDHIRLLAYAEALPLEPRARLLPEEKLEALLLAGDEDAVARLLREEPAGIAEERRRYLMTEVARRDRDLVEAAPKSLRWRVPNLRLGAAPQLRGRTMRSASRPLAQPRRR